MLAAIVCTVALTGILAFGGTEEAFATEQLAFVPASFSPFGAFSNPTGIAVDEAHKEVFVADGGGNDVVDVFDAETGVLLGSISGTGTETFEFAREPAGVAIDQTTGALYVSDVRHNVVDEFSRTGAGSYAYACQINGWYGAGVQACHSSGGTPAEALVEPLGLAVDEQGDLYIANFGESGGKGSIEELSGEGKDIADIKESEHPQLHDEHVRALSVDATGDIFGVTYEAQSLFQLGRANLTGPVNNEIVSHAIDGFSVAVGGPNADLYVDRGGEIAEYKASGQVAITPELQLARHRLGGMSEGVAIDGQTGAIYASELEEDEIDAFHEKLVTVPDVKGGCTASAVTATEATLEDEVDPLGATGASYTFEYGLGTSPYEQQAGDSIAGNAFESVSVMANGLEPGTVYHCRVVATDGEAVAGEIAAHGPDSAVETPPLPPGVNEVAAFATEVGAETAVLNGAVNPGSSTVAPDGLDTTSYHFVYGTEPGRYTTALPTVGAVGVGLEPITIEQAIPQGSLRPDTTYHFALLASNDAGDATGEDQTFTTASSRPPPVLPLASTGGAVDVSQTAATLTGTVNPAGSPTVYRFEFGTTTAYGTVLPGQSGTEAQGVERTITGLQPAAEYHFRLCAQNEGGLQCGQDQSFTTPAFQGTALFAPAATPLIASTPVAFPGTGERGVVPTIKAPETRAQKLKKALKACTKDRRKRKRTSCEKEARKKYGPRAQKKNE
jgi:hypothetical protein